MKCEPASLMLVFNTPERVSSSSVLYSTYRYHCMVCAFFFFVQLNSQGKAFLATRDNFPVPMSVFQTRFINQTSQCVA